MRSFFTQIELYCFYSCGSSIYLKIRAVLTILYKFVLHVGTIALAIRIHRFKVPAIDDFKYISSLVYITSGLTVIIGITAFLLGNYPNVYSSIFALCIWIDATAFLGLTFIPKVNNDLLPILLMSKCVFLFM